MDKKQKVISIRVTPQEYDMLNSICKEQHITVSDYFRSQLCSQGQYNVPRQDISSILCHLYVRLEELGLSADSIAEEVHQLCQI